MHNRAGSRLFDKDKRLRQTIALPVCTCPPVSASAPVGTKQTSDHYLKGSTTWLNHYERTLTCPSGTETGRTSAPPLASAGFCSHSGADSTPARLQAGSRLQRPRNACTA